MPTVVPDASCGPGGGEDLRRGLEPCWGRSVTSEHSRLIVRLDPPDSADAWHLAVLASGRGGELVPIEQAIVDAGPERRDFEDEITRLERLVPALMRPGGTRRGQVILSADEAWEMMTVTGSQLLAAGFDVRVPALSRRKPKASLRVFADTASTTAVGANQLADVRWSAVFDDVELTAADIARLAKEARPLIRSGGRWVAIDRADLNEAAAALAERSKKTQLSGGEMLRLALGLEGGTLAGGISVAGSGWAADLLKAAANLSSAEARVPDGFVGELRSYQAEALAWLGFLDSVGLGGCLALDMGLGKTPTMLAHLLGRGHRPGARDRAAGRRRQLDGRGRAVHARLRVVVHHGANRASPDEIAAEVADADVVITTYGTAVRDVDAIAAGRVGSRHPRRGPGDQEPRERHVAVVAPHPGPYARRAHGHADRERSRRPVGDPRLHEPGPGRHRGRSSSPRCRATATALGSRPRTRCARSTASSSSGARRPNRRSRPSFPTRSTSSTTAR